MSFTAGNHVMISEEPFTSSNTVLQQRPDLALRQLSSWERQGRGWQVFDCPVELEPPLSPVIAQQTPAPPVRDDARKPTLIDSLLGRKRGCPAEAFDTPPATATTLEPRRAEISGHCWHEFRVFLPAKLKVLPETAEQLLLSLCYAAYPVSFEVIGLPGSIYIQFVCHSRDRAQLAQQLRSHFPEAVISEEAGLLESHWNEQPNRATVIADFGLAQAFVLPLNVSTSFESDPLVAITGALTSLSQGELGCLQVIFQAVKQPWSEQAWRLLAGSPSKSHSAHAPELLQLAKRKISRPLFAVIVRLAGKSVTEEGAWRIVKALGGGLAQFANPLGNSLIPLSNAGYARSDHERCLLSRQSFRTGMLLNSEELISLVHPPSLSVRVEELKRVGKKTKAAPAIATGHHLILGENRHGGVTRQVTLSAEQRTRHMYVVGASGTGKSTLLLNLIRQDIEHGQGIAVLDPHGDLIDHILGLVPEKRFDDVVLFDPSDDEYPIGFNILSAHSELEKTLLESDLVGVFRRLSTSWGDQMNSVLSNAILAFLESERGGTLSDLRRFLIETEFRYEFLRTVRDQEVVYYWVKEFPLLSGRPQAPLLTRLDTFLRPKPIRYMVTQKENRIDFAQIMNGSKIFLAKLSQGAIGEENSYLLGSLLVSKFHQMAISRQELAESERRHFYLYIDEFQNFVTPSMASILSGARKYRLGLILAHQELRQLSSKDTEVASAVITNPYTRVCFRVGDDDARKLSEGFAFFDATDLQNLSVGEAICRIDRAEYDFNLHTQPLPELDQELAEERKLEIQVRSRRKYACPRAEVESMLAEDRRVISIPSQAPATPRERPSRKAQTEPVVPPAVDELLQPSIPIPQAEIPQSAPEPPALRMTRSKPMAFETQLPGKGGQQHKYLQQLIKRWGEERGYKSTIEKQITGGSVDVALEKDCQAIACEITVTTNAEHEVGNITKCLAAGFGQVIVIASDKKSLNKIQTVAQKEIAETDIKKVYFFLPEDLYMHLDQIAAEGKCKEEVVKGYKVKVQYKSLSIEEQKVRKQAIAKTVLQAMKRLKEKD